MTDTDRTNATLLCGERWPYELEPASSINAGFGWLAPDGTFYGCDYGQHSIAAAHIAIRVLGMADDMSHHDARTAGYRLLGKQNWVHVSHIGANGISMETDDFRHATQAQLDAIMVWCSEHNLELPQKVALELQFR